MAFAVFRLQPAAGRAAPPQELVAAADAEAALIAVIDAETACGGLGCVVLPLRTFADPEIIVCTLS